MPVVHISTFTADDDLSETAVETERELSTTSSGLSIANPESDPVPTPPAPAKKRGRPKKQAVTSKDQWQSDLQEAPLEPAKNLKATITYYLAMFTETQMRKPDKQQKSINTFLCLSSDIKFDTLKAQLLQKIHEKLAPKTLAYSNYSIEWMIPRAQTAPMSLSTAEDYQFLVGHALKQKSPSASIVIALATPPTVTPTTVQTVTVKIVTGAVKMSLPGRSRRKRSNISNAKAETPLNVNINTKIQNLQKRWMCSKPGCSSKHCFVHPEHPDHFPLGHEHLAVWAAAWIMCHQRASTTLPTSKPPPNHHKFNNIPGRTAVSISPLLQRRLTECNQPATGQTGPVFNFNIPPEILGIFCPIGAAQPQPAQAVIEASRASSIPVDHNQLALVPSAAQHGQKLSLDEFCDRYCLSQDIHTKLHENGYTGTKTISFIVI
ncbi:hypothetical protein PAXINDRAFT_89848 [Paxillus involutus ATCC 200175]|uniref:Uncharacterized protein n=1 Tax=Paxillus involutus ATCC 200175 TaxID=664439 RepID=A0A0C9SNE4_PAXIN|nr:hypothetical protein PAXINDRAFT_89848 [Paxillus involutus ATCC 200175]